MSSSNIPRAAPVEVGALIAGKYVVERVLGAGGIGVVVAARHVHLDRLVAIKFLLPELVFNAEVVQRFSRESRAAAKLRSEHVAAVLDVGELPDGAPYMVMEYLQGCDLASLLDQRGPLSVADAIGYVLQAGEAIAEAHAAGIVHRDLKPANLFLTTRADGSPIVKVLDFGISKSAAALESIVALSLTSSTAVIGTPLYMSPEQMQSARGVDARADLWSLGAILYELLAGTPPFLAQTLPQLCIAVMQQEPTSLHRVRPDVPEGLSAIVGRCLAKERSNRYSSVSELANDLTRYASVNAEQSLRRIQGVSRGIPPLLSDEPILLGPAPPTPVQFRGEVAGVSAQPAQGVLTPSGAPVLVDSRSAGSGVSSPQSSSILLPVALGVAALFALGIGISVYTWQRTTQSSGVSPMPSSSETTSQPSASPLIPPIPRTADEPDASAGNSAVEAADASLEDAPRASASGAPHLPESGKEPGRPRRGAKSKQSSTSSPPSVSPKPTSQASTTTPSSDDLMSDRE